MERITTAIMVAIVGSGLAAAQAKNGARATAETKVENHRFALEYGIVLANDGPTRLPVGQFWNPGATPAVLTIEGPLGVGSSVLPPGRYAARVGRTAETTWVMRVENAPRTIGTTATVGGNLDFPITLGVATPPSDRLKAKWTLGKPDRDGGTGIALELRLGSDLFELRGTTWGGPERAANGWTAHGWTLPADLHAALTAAGAPTPFVTFQRPDANDPKRIRVFNLMVCGDTVGLVAASEGPGPDGVTPITQAAQMYAATEWKPAKSKALLVGASLIDIKGRLGMYMRMTDGPRQVSFSIHEPDYGQKK